MVFDGDKANMVVEDPKPNKGRFRIVRTAGLNQTCVVEQVDVMVENHIGQLNGGELNGISYYVPATEKSMCRVPSGGFLKMP